MLWDVCRIPDFRGISHAEHTGLLQTIYRDLHERGRVREDWFARQVRRIDRTDGDIDTLSKRLAYVRTWTYVAQRKGWVDNETHWREATRAVEDRLSDALHGALTQRFVDRRTSVLLRRLKQKEAIVAEVNDTGEVTVEGEFVGRLEGFRFIQDKARPGQEAKTLQQASLQALAPHFHLRADRFYNAPDTEIDFTEQGGLMWGSMRCGQARAGQRAAAPPGVKVFVDEAAGPDVAQKVRAPASAFHRPAHRDALRAVDDHPARRDPDRAGPRLRLPHGREFRRPPPWRRGRGGAALDQQARGQLRKHGVRFGQFTVFMPLLLKPAPTRLRLVLWGLSKGLDEFPEAPPPGLVTVPAGSGQPQGYFAMAGYRAAGERAIRIDMLERLADMLRAEDSRSGFEATADMLSITGMTLEQFAGLMQGLGYRAERGDREKVKPVDRAVADAPADEVAASSAGPRTPPRRRWRKFPTTVPPQWRRRPRKHPRCPPTSPTPRRQRRCPVTARLTWPNPNGRSSIPSPGRASPAAASRGRAASRPDRRASRKKGNAASPGASPRRRAAGPLRPSPRKKTGSTLTIPSPPR